MKRIMLIILCLGTVGAGPSLIPDWSTIVGEWELVKKAPATIQNKTSSGLSKIRSETIRGSDFEFSGTIQMLSSPSARSAVGLFFRQEGNRRYQIMVRQKAITVEHGTDEERTTLASMAHDGKGGIRVQISAKQDKIALTIQGRKLTVKDTNPIRGTGFSCITLDSIGLIQIIRLDEAKPP